LSSTKKRHGAGSIRVRTLKDGTQRFDVLIRDAPGQPQKQIGTFESREQAEALLVLAAIRRAEAGHHVPHDIGVFTLRHLGHLYLDALPANRLVTDKSRWQSRIETAEFIDWPLTQISEMAVRRWIDLMARTNIARGKSGGQLPSRSTLQNALNLLRSALRWAVIQGHIDTNAAKNVTISESTIVAPKTSALGEVFDYLREDEVRKLLEADLPLAQKTAFTLLAFTGARPKDLYLLTWDRVDVRGAAIRFRTHKKHRDYTASLLPLALEATRAWWMACGQPAAGLVFRGPKTYEHPQGAPHAKGYDWGWADSEPRPGKRVNGYRVRSGIRRHVPLYSLRHTAATHLLLGSDLYTGGRRWSPEEVASFLGHSDLSTVRRYMVGLGIASMRAVEESRLALKELAARMRK
jgi:integrase